ncbi:MAG: hypothetical protein GY757_18270 [bacterium]|nr:hypothetical protein [bacterium]
MKNLKKDIKENGLNLDMGLLSFNPESGDDLNSCAIACTLGCLWSNAGGTISKDDDLD